MDPARWQRIERLYHAALARPAEVRPEFLAEACGGDEGIRQDVQALLVTPATGEGVFAEPALAMAAQMVSDPCASLLTGRRLGVYELKERIGAGGMGEVYRARDTRLGRDVAIKILPRAFTADSDRLARFEREARVLASLNHPNIATVHGIEEGDVSGPAEAGHYVRGLVMELIDGNTLAERIARRPVPIWEALEIATQIAEALDAAHEKGIVHRDLKPANIKITASGSVKVLDFGLAKVAATDGAGSQAPTATLNRTQEGVIAGTAAYMSPEQARGQPVDKRTDIWAFGCVLYEVLTGQPAFAGATVSDTIVAILDRDPNLTRLPERTPDGITRLLARTLTKDQRQRLRDIGDAKFEIQAALTEGSQTSASGVARSHRFGLAWRVTAMAGMLALGVAAVALWRAGVPERSSTPTIGPLVRLTSDAGLTTEPSISPDGRLIAYASDRGGDGNLDIWIQQTTGGGAIRLTNDPANDQEPNISPDGSLVAFRSDRSPRGIYVVPALGGDARLIAPDGMMPRFSPDGRSIAFWTGNWLAPRGVVQARQAFVIPIDGGEPTRVAAGLASVGDPVWSPDGRALLVFGREATTGPNTRPEWWWMPLNGGAITPTGVYERLAEHGFQLNNTNTQPYPFAWSPQGVLFTATDAVAGAMDTAVTRSVWTIAIDQATGRVAGDPIRLTTGTTVDTSPSASREGQMVFAATTQHELIFGLPLDANAGRVTGPLRLLRADTAPTGRAGASEDGRLLVFPRYEVGAGGVWVRDLMTGRERQLAATPPTPLNPVISTDGNWVAYTVTTTERGGNAGPGVGYVVQTTGGAPRRVCEDCQIFQWSRDNRQLFIVEKTVLLNRLHVATGSRIPILAAAATAPTGDEEIDRPLLPPGERWIVFNTARKTFVAPLYPDRATPEEEWMAVYGHGGAERSAGLSPDGRLLYLLLERDGFRCLYALPVDPGNGHPIGEPFLVQHFHDPSRPWGSTGFGSATVTGMFVADLYEITGNVWMTTIE